MEESQGDPINSSMQWPVRPTNLLQAERREALLQDPSHPQFMGATKFIAVWLSACGNGESTVIHSKHPS